MVKRKIIIDTDCGGDDAIGIMAALARPDIIDVIAITCVWGNVSVDQGMENIGKLLDLYERDIPFYRGAEGPLLGETETIQWGGFGGDGFGDANFPPSMRVSSAPTTHAAVAMVDLLSKIDSVEDSSDSVYQLVTLGPLTNVALALRLNPRIFDHLGSSEYPGVVSMAGAMEAKGNSNMTAEFNVHCDPEAARIVLQHKGLRYPLWLISWEVSVNCAMTWNFFDQWLNRVRLSDGTLQGVDQNRTQAFIEKLFSRLEVFTRPQDDGSKPDTGDAECTQDVTCVIPDGVAMVAAMFTDDFVLESFSTFVTVELHGRESRGMTCVDWYGTDQSLMKKGRWRNCTVITKCSVEKFLDAMRSIVVEPSL